MRDCLDIGEARAGPLIPIGAVSQRTGLSTHVLRAWEKRYGAVEPKRIPGGVRGYDDADVIKLRLLKRATEAGYGIGRVAALSTGELLEILRDDAVPRASERERIAGTQVAACLEAVEAMDGPGVHRVLMRSLVIMGAERFVDGLAVPVLYRIGELWATGAICPAHEHLFSASLQRVLGWMIERLAVSRDAPTLVSTTPAGQRHEMGALLTGVVAAELGWKVEYLGPDLPSVDILRAATLVEASVVALSVVRETRVELLLPELKVLRDGLSESVAILIGGRAAFEHREELVHAGYTWLPELAALRGELQRLHRQYTEVPA